MTATEPQNGKRASLLRRLSQPVDLTAGTVAVEGTADAAGIQKVIEELGFEYKGRV